MRGTTAAEVNIRLGVAISIHVPREGDDTNTVANGMLMIISIHVPREGDDFYCI